MSVPATPLATVGPGLMLLRQDGHLSTVQELEHQREHLITHRVHRYHQSSPADPRAPGGVRTGRRVDLAEELTEEEAAGREDAAVSMDEATLDAEGHIAEGLAVDE